MEFMSVLGTRGFGFSYVCEGLDPIGARFYNDWMQETTQRIIKLLGLLLPDLLVKKCSCCVL